jgi:diguanylate cyclase (GGDEF)-like protein
MHRLLEKQLKKHIGKSFVSDPLLKSNEIRELLSAVEQAYEYNDQERHLLERTVDLNSKELNSANELLRKQNQEIAQLARQDVLTGLPNRYTYKEKVDQALKRARRYKRKFAIIFIDLDRFKIINDNLGHHIGDLLLCAVARRLTSCIREVDLIARLGGDEFTILSDEINGANEAEEIANRVLEGLSRPFRVKEHELMVTASIGISVFPSDGGDMIELGKNADIAMYRAKEVGRNNLQLYHPAMSYGTLEDMTFESDFRKALKRNELVLYYQPVVDLVSAKIIGLEALIRWRHPKRGLVPPADFIPLAEETGLILPIGEWVLQTACLQNKAWQDAGLPHVRVAVNISGRQLQHPDFMATVDRALQKSNLAPEYLELELTESIMMQRPKTTENVLQQVKARGIYLSIDDFGTGYSSLSNLRRFTINALKIDRSFVSDVPQDPEAATLVEAIAAMARSLKLKVVAEGVETQAQLDFLTKRGCNRIQGYLFSCPEPADRAAELLKKETALCLIPPAVAIG